MRLVFQNANGKERVIANVNNTEEAYSKIKEFCYDHDFHIPYTRVWGSLDEDGIFIDVGSWSENFKLTKE